MLKPVFYTRSFALNPFQAAGWLQVTAARWAALGGPDTATLAGSNPRLDLAQALALMRCPVELVDSSGMPAWWGYVSAITTHAGRLSTRTDLEPMANRIKAVYQVLPFDSNQWNPPQLETSWYDNLDSQATYGVKEKILRLSDSTAAQALAACGLALTDSGWLQARPALEKSPAAGVTFELRGWWHTLGWKYFTHSTGLIENLYEGPGFQSVGAAASSANIYQSFTVAGDDLVVNQVWLKLTLWRNPGDALQVDICADNSGAPGSSLATAQLDHSAFTPSFAWHCFTYATPPTLPAGLYWLQIHRTGSYDTLNNYRLKVDEFESYTGGEAWVNGAPRSTPADLLFRVSGSIETTQQIATMAGPTQAGQFLSGVRLEVASGIYTNPYRAGHLTAMQEITAHLSAGDSAGAKILAEVTQDRYLRLYLQPNASAAALYISNDGLIENKAGIPAPSWTPAAGQWAIVRGAWGEVGSEYQQVKDRVLLEAVELDPACGGLRAA